MVVSLNSGVGLVVVIVARSDRSESRATSTFPWPSLGYRTVPVMLVVKSPGAFFLFLDALRNLLQSSQQIDPVDRCPSRCRSAADELASDTLHYIDVVGVVELDVSLLRLNVARIGDVANFDLDG
jgi:hypothetical protein